MLTGQIPRWAIRVALGGVLTLAIADVILMRHHPIAARPRPIPEKVGLHADAEGGGVRVQWDRASRPVMNADHAVLQIEDGPLLSRVDLTGRQLDGSTVVYLPKSDRVTFRLEVFRGTQMTSDSTVFDVPQDGTLRRRAGAAQAVVEATRPSPFERVEPDIEVTQMRPTPVLAVQQTEEVRDPGPAAERPKESRFERVISKIPLLRRFGKHPQADETSSTR
jgi:hypothetical protein